MPGPDREVHQLHIAANIIDAALGQSISGLNRII